MAEIINEVNITTEMQKFYLDYAMSVIVSRALPDVRDGLKPVHRRILYAMHQMGLSPASPFTKSAKVVGEVLGKYHPHGDTPVYDALVRLAQDFSMRYRLITGQGNFGSVDGDPPAAMRYTEVKMARIAQELMFDIEKDTVPVTENFDATLNEPVFLPAKLPNLLLMGADGIAVGMATKIPPHNLTEVVDALIFMLDKTKVRSKEDLGKEIQGNNQFEFPVTLEEIMKFVKGPDFPTAASIYDIAEITSAYATGRGKIVMRAMCDTEDIGQGKTAIIVTELPYQVNKANLVAKIANLVKDKKLDGISDLRDESDRRGIRVYIELKRDAVPKKIVNNLYKKTEMQTTFPVNMVALVNGTPQTMTLKLILEEYIKHRVIIIRRRSEYELKQARSREHILEGLKIAVDHIDAVIKTIRESKDADVARTKLMERFKLTELQATAILDMQLRRLAALERQKIEDELIMVRETIEYLEDLLAHPEKILKVIREELVKLKGKYGDQRKTRVYKSKVGEFTDEQLIQNEETFVTVTKTGYIKRLSSSTFRTQGRGGKGVIGMTTKEEDEIDHIISAKTHDNVLFFTNKGKVYQLRVWDIPEATRTSKGKAIINLINISQDELVESVLTYSKDVDAKYIIMVTRNGTAKKTRISKYKNIRTNGIISIKLEKGDELVWCKLTNGEDDAILVTYNGKSIRFSEKEIRATGRDTMGVRGIILKEGDKVVGMGVISQKTSRNDFLTVMESGKGKRTPLSGFPKQKRGGQGVKVADVTSKTGKVVTAQVIPEETQNIILNSIKGNVVKLPIASLPKLGRATQGVILMRLKSGDKIAAATCA